MVRLVPVRESESGRNHIYASAAVAWEIAIKKSLGKLDEPDDLEEMIDANRFNPLQVTIPHALDVMLLPDHHRNPFDRILRSQALHEGFRLVTRDQESAKIGYRASWPEAASAKVRTA